MKTILFLLLSSLSACAANRSITVDVPNIPEGITCYSIVDDVRFARRTPVCDWRLRADLQDAVSEALADRLPAGSHIRLELETTIVDRVHVEFRYHLTGEHIDIAEAFAPDLKLRSLYSPGTLRLLYAQLADHIAEKL